MRGCTIDRCQLYLYRALEYFVNTENPDREKCKWWYWKDDYFYPSPCGARCVDCAFPHLAEPYSSLCRYFLAFFPRRYTANLRPHPQTIPTHKSNGWKLGIKLENATGSAAIRPRMGEAGIFPFAMRHASPRCVATIYFQGTNVWILHAL